MALNFQGIFSQGRPFSVTFDWLDIVNSAGYVLFDGTSAVNSSGHDYILIDSSRASSLLGISPYKSTSQAVQGTAFQGATGKAGDIDFNTSAFQDGQIIEGDCYLRIPVVGPNTASTANAVYVICKLRTWDGSTETEIASVQSPSENLTQNDDISFTLAMTVPRTVIKRGEVIRLTVECWSSNSVIFGLGHCPNDTAIQPVGSGSITAGSLVAGNSRLVIALPFKVDI